jgi:hypothetical protein
MNPSLSGLTVAVVVVLLRRIAVEGLQPRTFDTALPPEAVRALFEQAAAGVGWRVRGDEPVVAQSPLMYGLPHRIQLDTEAAGERTRGRVGVTRYSGRPVWGWPRRPWPLQRRISRFLAALAAADPTLRVGE